MLLQQKPSLSPEPAAVEFSIHEQRGQGVAEITRRCSVRADEVLAEELSPVDLSALDEAKEFLRSYLAEGERKTTDLQRWGLECGLSWPTIRRAKLDLGVTSHWHYEDGTKHRVWRKAEGVTP